MVEISSFGVKSAGPRLRHLVRAAECRMRKHRERMSFLGLKRGRENEGGRCERSRLHFEAKEGTVRNSCVGCAKWGNGNWDFDVYLVSR